MEEEQINETRQVDMLKPQESPVIKETEKPHKKKVIFLIIAIICLGLGTFFVLSAANDPTWPANAAEIDPVTLQPKKIGFFQTIKNFIFHSENIVTGQKEDRINILLLGIGGPGHDGPYLSDTNIIVSLKPSTREVALISIPRDLAVKFNGQGLRKINNADAFGEAMQVGSGGAYARKIFADTFSLDIPYYIRIDFNAFKELIDAVGGVDINVPKSFTDTLFPGAGDSYITTSFKAGMEHMDGERALTFARSRHGNNGEGSDFARAKRQQIVLSALKAKMMSAGTLLNPVAIQKMWDSFSKNVATNLDFGQMVYLANIGKDADGNIKNLVIDDSTNGFLKPVTGADGAFLLVPKTADFNDINSAIKNVFDTTSSLVTEEIQTPAATVPNSITSSIKIEVQNGTWRPGLAAKIKARLEEKGFRVETFGNSIKKPIAQTIVYIINKNISAEAVKTLVSQLSAQASNSLPDWLTNNYDDPSTTVSEIGPKFQPNTDLLVIIGDDTKQ